MAHVVYCGGEIVLLWFSLGGGCIVWFGRRVCWAHVLALAAHVSEYSFLRFREVLVNVFYVDERPGEEISGLNGFEPCRFGGKPDGGVEVADGGFDAGELVDVVDCVTVGGPCAHRRDVL